MENRRGLTLVDVLVTIFVVLLLVGVLISIFGNRTDRGRHNYCGANLKGLGTAMIVYANDYDDEFAVQGVGGSPMWTTGTSGFYDPDKDWSKADGVTVGASLYLLVREADVSPKSFVCPYSGEREYEGENPGDLDITELWDFGMYSADLEGEGIGSEYGPRNCVSYSYHMPYGPNGGRGRYVADGRRPSDFAVMADKNPWYDRKLSTGEFNVDSWIDYVGAMGAHYGEGELEKWKVRVANAQPHDRNGQNVLFADGHARFEKTSDVGVEHDNIYTRRGSAGGEGAIRIGEESEMAGYGIDNKWQPRDGGDSFLVNDDLRSERSRVF
jgi:prepilin-type processing-associated H-X9-DG protein